MSAPVTVAFNRDRSRAAFRLFHPKGNILTREMVQALESALESIEPNPHLKLITIEGDGPDFSFGASVPEHAPDEIARVLPEMHALVSEQDDSIHVAHCFPGSRHVQRIADDGVIPRKIVTLSAERHDPERDVDGTGEHVSAGRVGAAARADRRRTRDPRDCDGRSA